MAKIESPDVALLDYIAIYAAAPRTPNAPYFFLPRWHHVSSKYCDSYYGLYSAELSIQLWREDSSTGNVKKVHHIDYIDEHDIA